MDESELFAREAKRVLEFMGFSAPVFKSVEARRVPGALKTAFDLKLQGATTLRIIAELLSANDDRPSPQAWAALAATALQIGMSSGIVYQHSIRAAGSAKRTGGGARAAATKAAEGMLEALVAETRAPQEAVEKLAAQLNISPASVKQRIRRGRRTRRSQTG